MLTKIDYIEESFKEDTIDITTDGNNLFFANGILTHNSGMFTNLKELDFTYVAESIALSATSDFMTILGINEDDWVYQSEIHYKIVKNRLGGRVGEYGKFFLDKKSLKMYDQSELDLWIEEAKISGDERIINKTKD